MKRAAAKIVPKLLNFKHKQRRMDIPQEMLTTFNDDPDLLKKVITGDESWVYAYDIETKAQSSQWKRPGAHQNKTDWLSKTNWQSKMANIVHICMYRVSHLTFFTYNAYFVNGNT